MKKLMGIAVLVTGLFLTSFTAAHAVEALTLNGNNYQIKGFCKNDAGDYCSKGDIKNDEFKFADQKFIVDSFNNGVLGVGGSGNFSDSGMSFTANYSVITENSLDKYTFAIKGYNLMNIIIFGRMDIAYYQLSILGYPDTPQDETNSFFIGGKK